MSVFYCHQCGLYVDSDFVECDEGPDGNLWCIDCLDRLAEEEDEAQA